MKSVFVIIINILAVNNVRTYIHTKTSIASLAEGHPLIDDDLVFHINDEYAGKRTFRLDRITDIVIFRDEAYIYVED